MYDTGLKAIPMKNAGFLTLPLWNVLVLRAGFARHRSAAWRVRVMGTSLIAFCCAMVGLTRPAASETKGKVAVLGLEVVEGTFGVDLPTTVFAKALTDALRTRPKAASGPYVLAPNSERELIDFKMMTGCDNEAKECMAKMGKELSADFLIFGKVERREGNFQVSLRLLDVANKNFVRSVTDTIAMGEATGPALSTHGKTLYGKLVGAAALGNLTITASVPSGTVVVDGEPRGELKNGSAQVSNLAEGNHKIEVVASDGRKLSKDVALAAGATVEVAIEFPTVTNDPIVQPSKPDLAPTLLGREGTVSQKAPLNVWKGVFWGGTAVTVGGAVVWGLYAKKGYDLNQGPDSGACIWGEFSDESSTRCSYQRKTAIGVGMVGVGVVAAGLGYYFGYVKTKTATEQATRRKVQKTQFAVTPVVSPSTAGAVLRFDF